MIDPSPHGTATLILMGMEVVDATHTAVALGHIVDRPLSYFRRNAQSGSRTRKFASDHECAIAVWIDRRLRQ